ncbi:MULTISPECIES: GntR family transcriptional regulator [unclassified Variovorax]|uniref:GntR family transcriptional regulator n=1 Tax=unclassified Variovorax TaxID=663243 RepID=UPI00076D45CB|nr:MULTISPECIES: GntR family transcriptional regulator [unclassified Variovorax]KWT75305.1 transcriptional regulator, GntR family [Variovorax sp. WDL1]PNG51782.1 putative HTH-type transcriptional regulator [Variovorax sp. B2]PNG54129.1 putative HTH-type transcriptional regulator [Variovorax sp. B4]VTV11606.1 putative HTH-type transcriptional regulator YdfH [Variovorax sp. WDL1]
MDVARTLIKTWCASMNSDLHVKQNNLPDRIADHIVGAIARGTIAPGMRLREVEMCESLGVSRIPLREALRILQAQGVITTVPNRGSYVTQFGSAETLELSEIRSTVERTAFARVYARVRAEPALLGSLEEKLEELRRAARVTDQFHYARSDLAFHERVVELSGSPMLVAVWRSLARGVLFFMLQEKRVMLHYTKQVQDHERLFELLSSGTLEELQAEVGSHILRNLNVTTSNLTAPVAVASSKRSKKPGASHA